MSSRPGGIVGGAVIGLISALLGGLGGIAYIYLSGATSDSSRSGLMAALGLGLLVAAVLKLVGSLGVLGRRAWARVMLTVAVIASAVQAMLAMVSWGIFALRVELLVPRDDPPAWTPAASRWLRARRRPARTGRQRTCRLAGDAVGAGHLLRQLPAGGIGRGHPDRRRRAACSAWWRTVAR